MPRVEEYRRAAHLPKPLWKVAVQISRQSSVEILRGPGEQLIDELIERIQAVDSEEAQGSRLDSASFLDQWQGLGSQLVDYWSDYKPAGSLLVSAEQVATVKASTGRWIFPARGTPNSMREVEASVKFRMTPVLRAREEAGNG